MAPANYDISTVDLDDDRYEVKQAMIRNKYVVRDSAGNVALRGKQKMLKMKEEFPFVNGDDEDAFTVKAGGIMDVHESKALVQYGRRCASSVHTRTALPFWGQPIRNASRF